MSTHGVSRAIRALLVFQLGVGALLVAGDLSLDVPALPFTHPDAPALDAPVRPGDQRRRFDPGAAPDRRDPMPSSDLPERLAFRMDGTDTLTISGAFAPGDADRFVQFLDTARAIPGTVRLDSPGGSVADALAIGRALREVGARTEVAQDGICLSACPYAFAGGTERHAAPGARIGVHQHYFGESTILPAFMAVEDVQKGQAEVMAHLDDMGIDVRLMSLALSTPPDEIYILLPEELDRYGLVTAPRPQARRPSGKP